MNAPSWRKMLLTLVVVVVTLILAISAFMMLRYRPPKKDAAAILYNRFVKKTGVERRIGETEQEFAARVVRESALPEDKVQTVTVAYLNARYGPGAPDAEENLRRAIAEVA